MSSKLQRTTLVVLLSSSIACAGQEPTASSDGAAEPAAAAVGAQDLPSGHPPIDTPADPAAQVVPPPAGSGTGSAGMTWQVPSTWIAETPRNAMRKAQYRVAGPAGEGECVVYYFGPGQGGGARANAERWAAQFAQPGGGDPLAALRTETIVVGGISILTVEVGGVYDGGMPGTIGSGAALEDHLLLGAIVEGPDANWFFKFTGPRVTVEANREAFESMIGSLGRGV